MKKWIIIIGSIVIIGIIGGFLVWNFYINKGQPDFAALEPEYKVKAKRLYNDFKENPELANEKYVGPQGKMIQIEGPISKVEMADSLAVLVYAYEEGDFGDQGIRVTLLPQFTEQAKQLSKLKPIKVKGLCTGYNDTDVILIHGSIVD